MQQVASIRLFQTGTHRCGYYAEREARDLLLDPHDANLPQAYPTALASGFRRSGEHVYRPHCPGCQACVPVRLPIAEFVPSRAQRRCLAVNADVATRISAPHRNAARFALYQRYLAARHAGAGMDNPAPEDFDQFLRSRWSHTRFLELFLGDELIAVAATDHLPDALSAVYTFYEPTLDQRSLGTLAILKQIAWAREEAIPFLYLGYWIKGHPKMDYKARFRPLQALQAGRWQVLC